MLDSIEIHNFRSCADVRLRLGEPVVALLGKNGAGKSNVLHAIQLAAELCVGVQDSTLEFIAHANGASPRLALEFTINGRHFSYRVSRASDKHHKPHINEELHGDGQRLFRRTGESLEVSGKRFPKGVRMPGQLSSLFVLTQILPADDQLHQALTPVSKYLNAVRFYAHPQGAADRDDRPRSPFVTAAAFQKWKSAHEAGRPGRSVLNRLLYMHLYQTDKLDELRKLAGDDGLGLIAEIRVDEVKLRRGGMTDDGNDPAHSITFVPCVGIAGAGRPFRQGSLSAGAWRMICLLTYLIFDESSCMLVEQPEDSIHAGLLGKLMDIFITYSDRTQVICTTHSPRIMNLVGAAGIRVVTADEGATQIAELSVKQIQASESYLRNEGTLSEFLDTL